MSYWDKIVGAVKDEFGLAALVVLALLLLALRLFKSAPTKVRLGVFLVLVVAFLGLSCLAFIRSGPRPTDDRVSLASVPYTLSTTNPPAVKIGSSWEDLAHIGNDPDLCQSGVATVPSVEQGTGSVSFTIPSGARFVSGRLGNEIQPPTRQNCIDDPGGIWTATMVIGDRTRTFSTSSFLETHNFEIPVNSAQTIRIVVDPQGSRRCDHTYWCDVNFLVPK